MLGHKNSPQLPTNVKIARTESEGFISGNKILVKIWKELHPSIKADSSSSFGMVKKACLKRKIPKAFTQKGKIIPR